MMILPLLILTAYSFPIGALSTYDVSVDFNGYLPVLGGRIAKAQVEMSVEVSGLGATQSGDIRAASDIKTLKLTYNGAVMPFGTANIRDFFPKTTIEFSPFGHLLKTDAPDVKLPVRLPGLDPKRFPDITYLPFEFPQAGLEENRPFKFKKQFGGSLVEYEVTPTKVDESAISLAIKLSQTYTTFEDEHRNECDEASAEYRVVTSVVGEGSATFELKRGQVSQMAIDATASGHVTNPKTQLETDRKLKTKLKVALSTKL